jgi:hypothetical protein
MLLRALFKFLRHIRLKFPELRPRETASRGLARHHRALNVNQRELVGIILRQPQTTGLWL